VQDKEDEQRGEPMDVDYANDEFNMQQPVCFSYPKGQYHCQHDWNEYLQQLNRDLQRIQRQADKMEQANQTSIDPAGPIDWEVLIERAMLTEVLKRRYPPPIR
jgi:hypothetical protein